MEPKPPRNARSPRASRLPALVPQPPRSCSRQTGAIVYNSYNYGRNPFKPSTATNLVDEDKKLPLLTPEHRRIQKMAEKAKKEWEEAKRYRRQPICHLPKQQNKGRNKQLKQPALKTSMYQKRKKKETSRTPPPRDDDQPESLTMKFQAHLHDLEHKVMDLHLPDEDLTLVTTVRDVEQRASSFKEQTTMTGMRINEEEFTFVSLDQYRNLYKEYERLNVDGRFMSALNANESVIFVGMLVTPHQIKKALNAKMEVEFHKIIRQLMPTVPGWFFDKLEEQFKREEEERKEKANDFRDRYDLSTVRDIERCFDNMLEKYSRTGMVSKRTRDPGLTIDEFLKYSATIRTMSEEEAYRTFAVASVEALDPSDQRILTVDGFAHLVKTDML